MNKIVKRKLVGSIICFVIGIAFLIFSIINYNNISEEMLSYIRGFISGIIGVGIFTMILTIRALKNPTKGKELENEANDERLKTINDTAMAITFKISLISEAITSLICAFTGKMEIAMYLGLIILFQVVLYLITYYIVEKNN